MQIVVTIPDELAAKAQASGMSPESFVERILADELSATTAAKNGSSSEKDLAASLDALTEFSEEIPNLAVDAFSRESIYRDRA
jgi:hypothetical protein